MPRPTSKLFQPPGLLLPPPPRETCLMSMFSLNTKMLLKIELATILRSSTITNEIFSIRVSMKCATFK